MRILIFSGVFLFGLAVNSWALLFNFSDSSFNGTGVASMDISITGNSLEAILKNTSPLTTTNDLPNIPGITGFGFDFSNDPTPTLQSWTLTANEDVNGSLSSLRIDDQGGSGDWTMDTSLANISLDFLPHTQPQGQGGGVVIDGALFNSNLLGSSSLPSGQNDAYFTTATLVLNFNVTPGFLYEENASPFVRMQRVGDNGEGSLKLYGVPDGGGLDPGGGPIPAPEPSTIILMGAGLIGIGFAGRRKMKK